jgi:arylsulfatase A
MQSPCGAVRHGDYKLIEYFENNTVQLFNLKNDLGEQNDLAKQQAEKATELTAIRHAWREDVGAKMPTPK